MKSLILTLTLSIGLPLYAGQITLSASGATQVDPGMVSAPMFIRVSNNENPDPPASFLVAWQFKLVIVGEPGSQGTLTFASPLTQTFTPPSGTRRATCWRGTTSAST